MAGEGVVAGLIAWLMLSWLWAVRSPSGLLWLFGQLVVSMIVGTCLHELGHLVVGLAVGEPARKIRIGSGSTLFAFRVRGLIVQICTNPTGGGAVYFTDFDAPVSIPRRVAVLAAGPGMNLLAAAYGFGLAWSGASSWMVAFGIANTAQLVANLLPRTQVQGAVKYHTDGKQILRLLFGRPVRTTYHEGAPMAEDGQAVLVHAVEDAQLAGAHQITESHLLRAFDQDAGLSQVFADAGLRRKLPRPDYPEQSYQAPKWDAAALAVIEASFHKARDMGLGKPNAACICLALMDATSPAGRLLREAGISDAVLALAMRGLGQDSESASLVSPDLPLERWGTAADRVLDMAYRIATADRSNMIGTQHIVAALISDPSSRSAQALANLGFVLQRTDDPHLEPLDKPPLMSPQAAMTVAAALWRTGDSYPTGTGELCVGIIDQAEGIGAKIFNDAGITLESLIPALRMSQRESNQPAGCTAFSRRMWELRGSARVGAQRWLEARDDFLTALGTATTEEQRALSRNNAAWASLMSGDASLRTEALEMARAAHQFDPGLRAFNGTYGFALLENGSAAEAAAVLEPVAATHPRPRDRALDLCLLAMCHARLGRREDATTSLEAAREADPRCQLLAPAQAEIDSVAQAASVS